MAVWLKTYSPGASGDVNGRVNLDNVLYCQAFASSGSWRAGAFYEGGTGVGLVQITPDLYASLSDAMVAIDDLLLNGS